jgi:RimJ/RimL family protein N-acetyltransferase
MTKTLDKDLDLSHQPFVIRLARLSDAADLVTYMKVILLDRMSSIADHDEMYLDINREREHLKRLEDNPGGLAIVALNGREIIGFLTLEPARRRKIAHVVELGMSVKEGWRRKGVGLALVQFAERWAIEKTSTEKIALNVFSENISAINLYKKAGFVVEGQLKNHIKMDKEYQDLVLMSKVLAGNSKK